MLLFYEAFQKNPEYREGQAYIQNKRGVPFLSGVIGRRRAGPKLLICGVARQQIVRGGWLTAAYQSKVQPRNVPASIDR
jgi:hypothetical protein